MSNEKTELKGPLEGLLLSTYHQHPWCPRSAISYRTSCLLSESSFCSPRGGVVYRESWYVSTYGRACNRIGSMKITPCYPGNTAASLSDSMKNLGCYIGNRLTANQKMTLKQVLYLFSACKDGAQNRRPHRG